MKLITRTLIILAAGLLVAGALLTFGRSSLATEMREANPRGGHVEGHERPSGGFEGRGEGRGEGRPMGGFEGRGDHNAPSIGGLAEVGKNLVKIGLIVTLFVLGSLLLSRGRKDRPTNVQGSQL